MAIDLQCDFNQLYFGGSRVEEPRADYGIELSPRALAIARTFESLSEENKKAIQKIGDALAEQELGQTTNRAN